MAKIISLAAAAALVNDGMTVAFGGMTLYRRPVAFAIELLRRTKPPTGLHLLCFTAGYESDILIGAGCVASIETAYCGLEAWGFAPMFTQAAQAGLLDVRPASEASIVAGIRAGIAKLPFMPSRAWQGTDMLRVRPDVHTIYDPYTHEALTAFPALHCDVAVLHGLMADERGNVLINHNLGIDFELVYLADTVIITVEQLVASIPATSVGTIIPYPGCDWVVHAPDGAKPSSCYPIYGVQGGELLAYVDACAAQGFHDYMRLRWGADCRS